MTTDTLLPRAEERLHAARAAMSSRAATFSERQVRPLRDAVDAARSAVEAGEAGRAVEVLDAVEAYAALLAVAEQQLSALAQSIREDIDAGDVLERLRTGARVPSAIDVATAVAATRVILLDVDSARATGARHDPAELLELLGDADAEIDSAMSGYRRPDEQARRQLVLLESLRLAARLRADAVDLLGRSHGQRLSEAVRILVGETRDRLGTAVTLAAGDPRGAVDTARDAAARGRSALAEALIDLDGADAPTADDVPGSDGPGTDPFLRSLPRT